MANQKGRIDGALVTLRPLLLDVGLIAGADRLEYTPGSRRNNTAPAVEVVNSEGRERLECLPFFGGYGGSSAAFTSQAEVLSAVLAVLATLRALAGRQG